MIKHDELFSQAEAARMIGISRQRVSEMIEKKQIDAVEIAGRALVPGREIARRRENRQRRGEPVPLLSESGPRSTMSPHPPLTPEYP